MALAWNEQRYINNVDFEGHGRIEQHAAQEKERENLGLHSFDPKKITKSLKDGFFHLYIQMLLLLDSIPDDLAQEMELCVCHSAFHPFLSPHLRQQMMRRHYGEGFTVCPCAGWNVPELTVGKLDETFAKMARNSEHKLLEYQLPSNAMPVTAEGWEIVMEDFNCGKEAQHALLVLKTQPSRVLPGMLSGIAAVDHDRARACGRKIMAAIEDDPRSDAHHPRTVKLVWESQLFMTGLAEFVAGIPLPTLSREFRHERAKLRIASSVETEIEAKHARTTCERKKAFVGPVRISLANRLPMLERWLSMGHYSGEALYRHFQVARNLSDGAKQLGLHFHPVLFGSSAQDRHPAKMRARLCNVLYHADLETMFLDTSRENKLDGRTNNQRERDAAKLAGAPRVKMSHDVVIRRTMMDHQQHVFDTENGFFYSVPRYMLNVENLDGVLKTPASKRSKSNGHAAIPVILDAGDVVPYDLDEDVPGAHGNTQQLVFFRCVIARPSKKRTVVVAVGAGSRLDGNQSAVSLHEVLSEDAGGNECVLSGASRSSTNSASHVVGQMIGATCDIKDHVVKWEKLQQGWAFRGWSFDDMDYKDVLGVSDVVCQLFAAGALPTNEASLGYTASPEWWPVLHALKAAGFVENKHGDGDRWYLTENGRSRLQTTVRVRRSKPLFEVDVGKPAFHMTGYELMHCLEVEGWTWNEWIAESRRPKKMSPIADGYEDGAAKCFYTTLVQSIPYLRCLITAQEHVDAIPSPGTSQLIFL